MTRIHQIAGLGTLTVLVLGVLTAFIYTHRGLPDIVYYERVAIAGPTLQPPLEQVDIWVDPGQDMELRVTRDATFRYTTLIDQHGRRLREFQDGTTLSEQWLSVDEAAAQVQDWQQLLHGGFRALATYRLADAAGPIAHVTLDGHQALRFDTARHDGETQRLTVWIDAHSHEPLELRVQTPYYSYTQRVERLRRIDPGTLPSSFFDAPRPSTSSWATALHWLRGMLHIQQHS